MAKMAKMVIAGHQLRRDNERNRNNAETETQTASSAGVENAEPEEEVQATSGPDKRLSRVFDTCRTRVVEIGRSRALETGARALLAMRDAGASDEDAGAHEGASGAGETQDSGGRDSAISVRFQAGVPLRPGSLFPTDVQPVRFIREKTCIKEKEDWVLAALAHAVDMNVSSDQPRLSCYGFATLDAFTTALAQYSATNFVSKHCGAFDSLRDRHWDWGAGADTAADAGTVPATRVDACDSPLPVVW